MMIERAAWLKEKRHLAEERMDTLFAPIYDQNWGAEIAQSHRQFLRKFLALCPPDGLILDAACGTGKYWPLILAAGLKITGIDQSQGMLDRAHEKHPSVAIQKLGLQEMRYQKEFDGAICMDAMENIFPEDWLPILKNFHRALRRAAYFYFTVEIAAEADILHAFDAARQKELPVVYGEWADEEGYHYYPAIPQVKAWLRQARFRLIEEGIGDEYHHFLVQKILS